MAVKFEFYLSDEDAEKLFAVKEKMEKNQLTGNEYAKELLKSELYRELYRLHSNKVMDNCDAGDGVKY